MIETSLRNAGYRGTSSVIFEKGPSLEMTIVCAVQPIVARGREAFDVLLQHLGSSRFDLRFGAYTALLGIFTACPDFDPSLPPTDPRALEQRNEWASRRDWVTHKELNVPEAVPAWSRELWQDPALSNYGFWRSAVRYVFDLEQSNEVRADLRTVPHHLALLYAAEVFSGQVYNGGFASGLDETREHASAAAEWFDLIGAGELANVVREGIGLAPLAGSSAEARTNAQTDTLKKLDEAFNKMTAAGRDGTSPRVNTAELAGAFIRGHSELFPAE